MRKIYKFDDIVVNSTAKKKPEDSDRLHYIGLEHIEPGVFGFARWGSDITPKGDKLIMKQGDVLFGKRRAYQRKVAIAPFDGIFSAHGMVLRPREDVICKEYLPFFISSNQFMDTAQRISVGGLSPTINWKDLKKQEFTLPSLEEQYILADKLWAAYNLKESYKKMIIAIEEMVKSQFVEMFKSVSQIELSKLADISKGSTITRQETIEGEVPVVAGGKEPSCFHNTNNRPAHIITVSASGAYAGYVNYWDVPIFASDCNTISPKDRAKENTYFLYKCLQTMQEQVYLLQKGGAQPHVYGKDLALLLIPNPGLKLKDSFINIAQQADQSKQELTQSIEKVDRVIKSLLQ